MNQFDENELRKKIRSDLEKKHQEKEKITNNKIEDVKLKTDDPKLSTILKNRIRQIEEDNLYSQHPEFFKCENHLHETTWLTALEKAEQHEYYLLEISSWQKFKNSIFKNSKEQFPQTKEVVQYRKEIRDKIEKDIEERLIKYEQSIKHYEHKKQKNRIDDIIEQEEETFYKNHPDYKLYRNYLGNTRWLTDEEASVEEEYTERVRSSKEKFLIYSGWIVLVILIVGISYFIKTNYINVQEVGYVSLSVNEERGQLYVDEKLFLGFSNDQPFQLSKGPHSIVYRKDGFLSQPKIQNVEILLDDTLHIEFQLEAKSSDSQGFVKINAMYNDSKLFVDDEFYGIVEKNKNFLLSAGNHTIELKKDDFYVSPSSKDFVINAGDTIELNFTFQPKSNGKKVTSTVKSGLIEINSNIKGANIYLNRKDTGFKTDYVFNKLPFSNYIITVEKDGYVPFPKEKEIKLSSNDNYKKITFNLTRATMPVRIVTRPANGKIIVNDRELGTGKWSGSLPLGVHKIRFGDIDYFKKPVETEFVVKENSNSEFVFRYESDFSIEFKPSGIKPENVNATIQLGYVDENNNFISDPRNGPETRDSEVLNDKIWWLGNAFNYRIPPANEAVAFSFFLPEKTEFGYDFSMKLWGYDSEISYPLELSGGCNIRIEVNNIEIHQKYEPDFVLSRANESRFISFQLGNVLRNGRNHIVISTAKINKTFFALWKLEIK